MQTTRQTNQITAMQWTDTNDQIKSISAAAFPRIADQSPELMDKFASADIEQGL